LGGLRQLPSSWIFRLLLPAADHLALEVQTHPFQLCGFTNNRLPEKWGGQIIGGLAYVFSNEAGITKVENTNTC
jgi:hypothetical protein